MLRSIGSKIIDTITQGDDRDHQVKIGPSDMAKLCEVCLGRTLMRETADVDFGLKAWIGTAVHEKLERDERDPDILVEQNLPVYTIEGYGEVRGTTDRYDPEFFAVVDYKTGDLKNIKKYKKQYLVVGDHVTFYSTTLEEHYNQGCIYGLMREQAGYKVKTVAIAYIPRDSNSVGDILVVEWPYSRERAEALLERARLIFNHTQEHGLDGLESDPSCWQCNQTGGWR